MSQPAIGFDQIIAPLPRERFLSDYWCRSFLHQPGAKARFTPLLHWEALAGILQWHPPAQPQLRLFQEGAPIDMRRYIDGPIGQLRLNAGNLIALLAQGAHLILDQVNTVAPAVAHLTAAMEEALACPVTADLQAGWRSQRALNLTWEPREKFVVQLSGRQRWQVFAPTRPHPLADDIEPSPSPTAQPLWDGTLNDGDLLYIPRGFWHCALALDEPSLHLSLDAEPATGADFLHWWMGDLRRHAEIRAAFTNPDAATRKAYMDRLLQHLEASVNADPLGAFARERQASRRTAPSLRLPHAPIEQATALAGASPPGALSIRLAGQNALHIEHPEGQPVARFFAAGQHWFIRAEFIAAFQRLSGRDSVPFHDLAAMIADPNLHAMLAATLDSLATAGVLFKEGDANR